MPEKRLIEDMQRPPRAGRTDAAAYIGALTGELAALARRHDLEVLTYLLEMAHREADSATRPDAGS